MSALSTPSKVQLSNILKWAPATVLLIGMVLILSILGATRAREADMFESATKAIQSNVDFAVEDMAQRLKSKETNLATEIATIRRQVNGQPYSEGVAYIRGESLTGPVENATISLYSLDGTLLSGASAPEHLSDADLKAVPDTRTNSDRPMQVLPLGTKNGAQTLRYGALIPFKDGRKLLVAELPLSTVLPSNWLNLLAPDYVIQVEAVGSTDPLVITHGKGPLPRSSNFHADWAARLPFTLEARKSISNSSIRSVSLEVSGETAYQETTARARATNLLAVAVCVLLTLAGTAIIYVFRRAKHNQRSLLRLVTIDTLTELPNRRSMNDTLDKVFSQPYEKRQKIGLLFVDLDNFKPVNDTYGHETGDLLLREVAARMRAALSPSETVCRLGGDEFAIISSQAKPDRLRKIAQSIVDCLSEPFSIGAAQINTAASVGLAYSGDVRSSTELLKNADMAMYDAKNAGKGNYREFSAEMAKAAIEREQIAMDIRPALRKKEFHLVYQPKVNAFTGAVSGYEALIRWVHPQRGFISPGVFIPLAEAHGVIMDVGAWVLSEALAQTREWHRKDKGWRTVAVNVSALQLLDPDFVGLVKAELERYHVPANCLQLELTESVLARNVSAAKRALNALRRIGVKIAIDDFGTGYSSLNSLQQFDIDYLKVDQSFVRDMASDSGSKICRSIISLAHSLGMTVIAEGVETHEQFGALFEMGCDELQGYYFAKPLSANDAPKFNPQDLGLWVQLDYARERLKGMANLVHAAIPEYTHQLLEDELEQLTQPAPLGDDAL